MADETYPQELRYDKEHEWVRVEGDNAVIGISDFAQDQLGEVVYVDLPSVGSRSWRARPSARSSRSSPCPSCTRRSPARSSRSTTLWDAPETVNEDRTATAG